MSNNILYEDPAPTVPGILYRIDLVSGRPTFLSDAVYEICGYTAEEIISGRIRWLDDIVVEEDRCKLPKSIAAGQNPDQSSIEYRIKHQSGDIRWVLDRAVPVKSQGTLRWLDGIILDISKEKRSAIQLATKNDEMASLLRSLDDIVFEIDQEGRFKNYYAKDWHTFMLPPALCLNKTIAEAFRSLPELGPVFEDAYRKTIVEHSNHTIEYSYQMDGATRWFRAKFVNLPKPGTVSILVRDITKRKKAELALKKQELELELAIKGGDLGTWSWYISTGEISFNEGCARMLGYRPDEINPHISFLEKRMHPDDKVFVMHALQAHVNGLTDFYEADYRLKHKDGERWVWVLHHSKIVEADGQGKPLRMSGTFLDISARKKAESANLNLQFRLEQFKAAINEATIVSVADLKGTIKYANKKFREISQYSLEELVGNKHNIINSGHHPKSFWKDMWRTIGKGSIWRSEVKNKRKDGTFYWVDTFIIPLKNTNNQIQEYLSIRNDITEKKENEIRLQQALERAEESDRLKSSFLANISHEIRTPMNAIMGFSELLMTDRPDLPEAKRSEFIRLIHQRSKDLLGVVNNILDISKIEAGQASTVPVLGDIRELFGSILVTFKAETLHLKNKEVVIKSVNRLQGSQNIIKGDFLRLYQVLNNLLSNAAKFTHAGSIELGCRLTGQEQLLFWIRDTGIGIPREKLDIIFLPFRQSDESIHQQYGGSGLGLAISRGFVELWGGKIWAESQVGKGSVFYFTMPWTPVHGIGTTQAKRFEFAINSDRANLLLLKQNL